MRAGRRELLTLLFSNPARQYYVNEIVRAAGVGTGAVQRELVRFTRVGLIARSRRGNLVLYQANRACPIFPDHRAIIDKTSGLTGVLRSALSPLRRRIVSAFVYGSLARGGESAGSDIGA